MQDLISRQRRRCAVFAAAMAALSSSAFAGDITWLGTTDTSWSTGTNWSGGVAPADDLTTDVAVFNTAFTNQPNAGVRSIAGLRVGVGRTTAFTLSSGTTGTGLSIGGNGIDMSAVTGNYTFTLGTNATNLFTVAAPQTWTVSSTTQLTVGGTIAINNLITLNGSNITRFSSANTGAGGITTNSGTLIINNASGIGTGTLTIGGGSLNTAGIAMTTNNPQVWNGDFTFLGTGGLNLGTGAVTMNGNRQINVSGTVNALTVGGVISGAGSLSKTGTGPLVLSGANTFSGGLVVRSGNVIAAVSNVGTTSGAAGPSTSAITLGSSTGASAGVLASATVSNPITLGTSSIGTLSHGNNGGTSVGTFSGPISLNNNPLTLTATGTGSAAFTGGITGTGNLTIAGSSTAIRTISTGAVNNIGTITNSATGTGSTTINALIGTNVTGVIQNSATSTLVLTNVGNTFTNNGTTTFGVQIKAGTLEAQQTTIGSALGAGAVTLGDTTGSANATLQLQGLGATFSNAVVLGGSTGTLTLATRNSGTAATFNGGVTGTGNLTLNNGVNNNAQPLNIGTNSLNNTGTITNATGGSGVGGVVISAVIGPNVTGVIQNSSNGPMTLSGSNTYTSATTVTLGALYANALAGSSTGTGPVNVNIAGMLGGTGRVGGAVTVNGTASPGPVAGGISTLTVTAANTALTFANDSTYRFQTGTGSAADLINLTGTTSTVGFGSTWNLNITAATGDPTGGTFTLIDYTGTDPVLPSTINFTGAYQGLVSIDTLNSAVVISSVTAVVPEPGTVGVSMIVAGGLLLRRRRLIAR